jgi:hypothetical protein
MLAEKVESCEEYDAARKEGFIYFQGCFFRPPELMTANEIPANRLNYIRMLQAVSKPELEQREVARVIASEASILLSPAALSPLGCFWIQQEDPLCWARAVAPRRTRSAPFGFGDSHIRCRPGQDFRTGCYLPWSGGVSARCFQPRFNPAIPTCFCLGCFP